MRVGTGTIPVRRVQTLEKAQQAEKKLEQATAKPVFEVFGWEKTWDQYASLIQAKMATVGTGPGRTPTSQMFVQAETLGQKDVPMHVPTSQSLRTSLSFIPFAKYAMPSEKAFFSKLSRSEKTEALLWESVGIALVAGLPVLKAGVKGVKKLAHWRQSQATMNLLPIEDAIAKITEKGGKWKGFEYERSAARALRKQGFEKSEANTVMNVLQGSDKVALKDLAYNKQLAGKPLSKAWQKNIVREKVKAYGGLEFSEELKKSLDYGTLQSQYYSWLYAHNLKKQGFSGAFASNIVKAQAETFFGPQMAKDISFKTLNPEEVANLVANMFSPAGHKFLRTAHSLGSDFYSVPWIIPSRSVAGASEKLFGFQSGVYDKIVQAKVNTGTYMTDKLTLFMQMAAQRGFGDIKAKGESFKFVANKKTWTKGVLAEASTLMRQADDLAMQARAGNKKWTEANTLISQMMERAGAKSPIVLEAVGLLRDYHDVLYKDLLTKWLPKIMHSAPLSAHGNRAVRVLGRSLGPKIDAAFSSTAPMTYENRVKAVKGVLDKYKDLLKDPQFLEAGTKKTENILTGLLGRLAYGKEEAFPAYLSHYFPRMRALGQALEKNFTDTLLGPGRASFTKTRKLIQSQNNITDLTKMVELRTLAQAKQIYMHDELHGIVRHAKTLPNPLKVYTEGLIAKAVGRPSRADEIVASFLDKLPGTKGWDAKRTMSATRTLNGLQHSGLLGLRPFTIARNLAQPYLLTGTDLGGKAIDQASVLAGTALAFNKNHRAYIRSIGGITEAFTGQEVRALLPKIKKLPQIDDIKDAFMAAFQWSDKTNRYISGGAAVYKWNRSIKKVGTNPQKLSKALNLKTRLPWVQDKIETLIELEKWDEAKLVFVNDVIADTQFLYGAIEAPAALGSGGVQKIITSYHSWWMNFGHVLHKWAKTGEGTDKFKRMVTGMLTHAAVEQAIEGWAGRRAGHATTFLGPLPVIGTNQDFIPPAVEPILGLGQTLGAVGSMTQNLLTNDYSPQDLDTAIERATKTLSTVGTTFVPGGLMIKQTYKGFKREGTTGAVKGFLGKKDK